MASQPLKRIYFDTNILYRWPHPPNDIYSIFGVAKWLGAQLFMPEVVEGELEAQFAAALDWPSMRLTMAARIPSRIPFVAQFIVGYSTWTVE